MMNKRSIEERILLAQSGELSPRERTRLEHELEQNPALRAYRGDLDRLSATLREQRPDEEVSEVTLQRIRNAAEQAARPTHRIRSSITWGPALAYAAAAVLVLGAGLMIVNRLTGPGAVQVAEDTTSRVPPEILMWDADLDAEIAALDEMMAMALGDTDESESTQESLEELAEELIELEGIQI